MATVIATICQQPTAMCAKEKIMRTNIVISGRVHTVILKESWRVASNSQMIMAKRKKKKKTLSTLLHATQIVCNYAVGYIYVEFSVVPGKCSLFTLTLLRLNLIRSLILYFLSFLSFFIFFNIFLFCLFALDI